MHVVLAYSGGLDTSAIVPWLIEERGCSVVAVVGDVGQGTAELDGIEAKAISSGACACHVVDLKHTFVEDYVLPTLLAGAVYEERYLLGTAMARPLLAKVQVDVAREVGASAVAHGCTGKGNDQVRFESTYAALAPDLEVIAPWREWSLRSRGDLLEYLAQRGIPCAASAEKIYSRDANLWHVSHEGGELEDPWSPPPEDLWLRTVSVDAAPDTPDHVCVGFEHGRVRSLDGQQLPSDVILAELNGLAGEHGVGRVDLVENRLVGMKSRGCYETPGGTVLLEALTSLEELVLDRTTRALKRRLAVDFAELVYTGQWFTPARRAISAAADSIAETLTGDIVVRLHKGTAVSVQRRSPHSLYSEAFATFESDEVYDQTHAEGFIRLFSLPSRIAALSAAEQVEVPS